MATTCKALEVRLDQAGVVADPVFVVSLASLSIPELLKLRLRNPIPGMQEP